MHYEESDSDGTLQLDVEGKIDALTSEEFQNIVLKAFTKDKNVVLNLEGVTYMSSAGLRALVLGEKTARSKGGKMVIINLQPQVHEVLKVTGFDSMLDIR
ncbi:MAG: STAS domain-containing protein [Eubacterium sp.]|nr:STAS domain-containing protein [Eubacterium sp.]